VLYSCGEQGLSKGNSITRSEKRGNLSPSWDPKNTRVFMVGVLEWQDAATFSSFDKTGRLDEEIFNFFKNAGVPAAQMLFIKDKEALTQGLNKKMADFLDKSGPEEVLFFYYAGHGYHNAQDDVCLASYDVGGDREWTVNSIVKTIQDHFKGKLVLLTADCCASGGLAAAAKKNGNGKMVALNSVISKDASTGNWTFSNALLYGLQGKNYVDTDQDQKITLPELADFIDTEMAIVEGQKSASYIPDNLKGWVVSDQIPLKSNERIGERVNVDYDGTDYMGRIIEVKDGKYDIQFYSYTSTETDWVSADRLKKLQLKNLPEGTSVSVLFEGKWYPAKVLDSNAGMHYVHYDNYGDEWNEWVGKNRIKKQ